MRRIWMALVCAFVGAPALYVVYQAAATLKVLTEVERERDDWQRPADVLMLLGVRRGDTVVDFGSGAGYFSLKLAPIVGDAGSVFATDIRRDSLAFLWIRARAGRHHNLHIVHGDPDNPDLTGIQADAILISNTYHELAAPARMLIMLYQPLKPGGRLVILDRAPRSGAAHADAALRHGRPPSLVEDELRAAAFSIIQRDDRFIDRPQDDDVWWAIAARKP